MRGLNLTYLLLAVLPSVYAAIDQEYHAYMWARYCHAQGNEPGANESYRFLLKSGASVHVYPSFIEYLFDIGHHHAVVQLIPAVGNSTALSPKVRLLFIQSLQAIGNTVQALAQIELLLSDVKDPETVYIASQLYLQSNNPLRALRLIDEYLEEKNGQDHIPLFRLLQAQAFMFLQKYGPAKESLQAVLALRPQFDKALLLLGLVYELEGNHREAVRHYQKFLTINGPHPVISEQVKRLQLQFK